MRRRAFCWLSMFECVVLLTGPGERAILSTRLRAVRSNLEIVAVSSAAQLRALEPRALSRARLIAFVTSVIVPGRVLAGLGYGAYNFHPGPPDYPGLSPAQFAIYEGARRFGVTVHRMVEAVDAGPIVASAEFGMPEPRVLATIETLAFQHLARLFWELTPALVESAPLPELTTPWGAHRSTRSALEALCDIAPDIPAAELDRRIAAFGRSPLGLRPTVTLHGHRFRLELPQDADTTPAVRTENTAAPSAGQSRARR